MSRCAWVPPNDPLYTRYHDTEWGVPEYDDRALYEKLVLDGFQAGLSWRTILHKRAAFREAFEGFEPERVARFGEADVARLLGDARIVRSRTKIDGAIRNARAWLAVMEEESFSAWLWSFYGGEPCRNAWATTAEVPAQTDESRLMARALKKRGFVFCGPVITYAFCQAVGMVDDHPLTCFRHGAASA
nr:DNA-3-methyladenine glycosylase I [Parvularcula dongshanensis]